MDKIMRTVRTAVPGNRAYVAAVIPVIIIFGLMWLVAEVGMAKAVNRGWEQQPIGIESALAVTIVLTMIIGIALNRAGEMNQGERQDVGTINHGFKELASYVSIDIKAFGVLTQLCETGRHFLCRQNVVVTCWNNQEMDGSWDAVFNEMTRRIINSKKMSEVAKDKASDTVKEIRSAFGRIETRRDHPVPLSMYLVCSLFIGITVFLFVVSAVSGEGDFYIGLGTAFVLLYGLVVVMILIRENEGVLGTVRNRISPDACYERWVKAIEDQFKRNRGMSREDIDYLFEPDSALGDEDVAVLRLTIRAS